MFTLKRKKQRQDDTDPGFGVAQTRNLLPLRHLSDDEFERIAAHATAERYQSGQSLFNVHDDAGWLYYLLDGVVEITSKDGASYTASGGTIETLYPLTPQAPARVSAVAKTDVSVVEFPADLFELAAKPEAEAGTDIEVEEISVENEAEETLDNRILFDVYRDLTGGELVLPSLPDVAVRIRTAIDDPEHGAETIAKIIQADPSTAAYCISVANNAAFAAASPITDIREAIVRMGISATRDLVTAYALRGLFQTKNPLCKQLMRQVWQHSCRIGALSHIIARDLTRLSPERAMLTGTLHDIGVLVLIGQAEAHPQLLGSEKTLFALLAELGGQIGAMLLRAWKIPDALVDATLHAEDWMRDAGPQSDLCDVVLLAHAHDPTAQPWSTTPPAIEDLPAYCKLENRSLTADSKLEVLDQAKDELTALAQLLNG